MPESLTLRLATASDVPAIVAFVNSVLTETAAQKAPLMDEAFYRWQYDLDRDVVVIAEDGGSVLAHYPLVRYPLRWKDRVLSAGVCQDLSVSDRLRGRGVFRQMGDLANKRAQEIGIDVLFSFPNHRSITGFTKHHGYSLVGEIGWRVAIVSPLSALPPLRRLTQALARRRGAPAAPGPWNIDAVAAGIPNGGPIRVRRDSSFVNWRFSERPHSQYWGLSEPEGDAARAWLAFRTQKLKGLTVGLVMDLTAAPGSTAVQTRLLRRALTNLKAQGAVLALWAGTPGAGDPDAFRRAGFWSLPPRLAPRHLNLVVRALNPAYAALERDLHAWHLTLADWDVF